MQAQVGLLPDESLADGVIRAEALCDLGYPNWRARETWRRRALLAGRSGALDYPGTSWRDRPAIDQGNDVFLCGDSVAAPSLLSEVSWSSAVTAAEGALRRSEERSSTSNPGVLANPKSSTSRRMRWAIRREVELLASGGALDPPQPPTRPLAQPTCMHTC